MELKARLYFLESYKDKKVNILFIAKMGMKNAFETLHNEIKCALSIKVSNFNKTSQELRKLPYKLHNLPVSSCFLKTTTLQKRLWLKF